jgi:hypothetical protein
MVLRKTGDSTKSEKRAEQVLPEIGGSGEGSGWEVAQCIHMQVNVETIK